MRRGCAPVAGCDEAGRGPLAGPVVAAAVILDPARVPKGLEDSKGAQRGKTRDELFDIICATAEVAVAIAPPARIDRDNILRASLWGACEGGLRAAAHSRNSCSSTDGTACPWNARSRP
jgi:ribonuclease HII